MGITVRPTSSDCCENNSKKKKNYMQNIYNHAWHMVLINVSYPYNFDIIIFKFK